MLKEISMIYGKYSLHDIRCDLTKVPNPTLFGSNKADKFAHCSFGMEI